MVARFAFLPFVALRLSLHAAVKRRFSGLSCVLFVAFNAFFWMANALIISESCC